MEKLRAFRNHDETGVTFERSYYRNQDSGEVSFVDRDLAGNEYAPIGIIFNDPNPIRWDKLKPGDWVYHIGTMTDKIYAWRVFRVETCPSILVLSRERLDVKKFRLEQGTYERGRASVTTIIAPIEPDRTFELAPNQYHEQFEWLRPEVDDDEKL